MARGPLLKLKPTNLQAPTFDYEAKVHQLAAFWPTASAVRGPSDIPLSAIDGWPTSLAAEEDHLKSAWGWGSPQFLGGIESRGKEKPDFMIAYDAEDTTSPRNLIATKVAQLLPEYERQKVELPRDGYRGACILVFSPMNTSSTPTNKRWSLNELRTVLHFHLCPDAAAQYNAHDNPMHRMFGGMPM